MSEDGLPASRLAARAPTTLKALFWCQALAIAWFALFDGAGQARLQWLLRLDGAAMHLGAFLVASATAFLAYKALPASAITPRLERQHRDLELRCQNATAFAALS